MTRSERRVAVRQVTGKPGAIQMQQIGKSGSGLIHRFADNAQITDQFIIVVAEC